MRRIAADWLLRAALEPPSKEITVNQSLYDTPLNRPDGSPATLAELKNQDMTPDDPISLASIAAALN